MTTTYAGERPGSPTLTTSSGRPRTTGTINVYLTGTTTPASLYNNRTRDATIANPLPVSVAVGAPGLDTVGNYTYWTEPGVYDEWVDGTKLLTVTVPLDPAEVTGGGGGGSGVSSFNTRTGAVTLASGDVSGAGGLLIANNLSDVANAATARTSLGLGTAATHATTDYDAAGAAAAAQAAAQAASQPLDSDLTAIAALSTTAYGRALLALADAAAGRTALGLGTVATHATTEYALAAAAVPTGGATGTVLRKNSGTDYDTLWALPSRVVFTVHADASVVNSTTPTDLATGAVPTSVVADDVIRFCFTGDALNNSGSGVGYTFTVKLGATSILSATGAIPTSAVRKTWRLDGSIIVVNPASDQRADCLYLSNGTVAGGFAIAPINTNMLGGAGRGTATEDLTTTKNLVLTVTLATANASTDCVLHEAHAEVIKK